jgi:phosphoenolpyruvate synthase/pyruvate phosphate dikinase
VALVVTFAAAGADGADVGVVGGKGACLGQLARAGVAVPPGFVITVEAFAAAMSVIDPDSELRAGIEALDAADVAGIARVASRFREIVTAAALPAEVSAAVEASYGALASPGEGGMPDAGATPDAGAAGAGAPGASAPHASAPDVAVRSSATVEDSAEASFAGLQDTYLGVSGAASVLDHVRRCWASLYNDESVAYRRRLGLPEAGVAMAVVVQRMAAPRAAGVMFTRSPVTGDRSVVAIEGTWGLGSALVSGDVTPDSWVISKITGEITGRRISPKVKIHSYAPNEILASPSPSAGSTAGQAVTGSAGTTPTHESPEPAEAEVGQSGRADPKGEPSEAAAIDVAAQAGGTGRVTVSDTPPDLRDAPCLTDDEIRALAAVARRVEAHYGTPQDIEWAVLDAPFAQAPAGSPALHVTAESRIVLLQSRPETVWASRDIAPAGAPKPRAADHVLALFGKPL